MEEKKYLPIGSVVKLKDGKHLFMINGYKIKNNDVIYDYCASLFPDGILSFNDVMVFNHDQIDTIVFEGYKNDDHNKANNMLKGYK